MGLARKVIIMTSTIKGSICGVMSAIAYGLNPLGALNLYDTGLNVDSVIFYRYGLAAVILAGIMLLQKNSFKIGRRDLLRCACLGVVFSMSSISCFASFNYMDAGVACTILFIYPVMVAVIMAVFFKERITVIAVLAIALALAGISLLYYGGNGTVLSGMGVLLVMISALTYAVYIVVVNKSGLRLPPVTLTFFVMLFGVLAVGLHSLVSEEYHLQLLTSLRQWQWLAMLAVLPTVLSLILMVVSIKNIGSTPTAIMGALEPVTAVVIGVAVFSESLTLRIAAGIFLILAAVFLIIIEKPLLHRLWHRRRVW